MGAQIIALRDCGCLSSKTDIHHPLTMKSLLFFSSLLLLFHGHKSDFASQLAIFISDTPAGYTVAQEVRNGQNCHCRVPATTLPQSSVFTMSTTPVIATDAVTTTTTTTTTTSTTTATTTTFPTGASSSGLTYG